MSSLLATATRSNSIRCATRTVTVSAGSRARCTSKRFVNLHHRVRTELPVTPKRWPAVLAVTIAGVSGWAAFLLYATNQEKLSSSVVRQIMRTVQQSADLQALLGDGIHPEPVWYLNGDPRIHGQISTLQGNIDVCFRVRGTKGAGTLYFTSFRKAKGEQFTILRFKVIGDSGAVVLLPRTS